MNIFTNTIVCLKPDGNTTDIGMKLFPPNCPKINYNNQCSSNFSAWLPAITVCRQTFFV